MQTVLFTVLSVAAVVIAAAFTVLVLGIVCETKKIGRACEDVSHFLKRIESELAITAHDVRIALGDIDRLAGEVTETVRRIDRIAADVERLVSGAQVASVAAKVIKSSTGGISSVYEGVKQGIRTLWGLQDTNKEGTSR